MDLTLAFEQQKDYMLSDVQSLTKIEKFILDTVRLCKDFEVKLDKVNSKMDSIEMIFVTLYKMIT